MTAMVVPGRSIGIILVLFIVAAHCDAEVEFYPAWRETA
jgi:hypothetical protein